VSYILEVVNVTVTLLDIIFLGLTCLICLATQVSWFFEKTEAGAKALSWLKKNVFHNET